jgi:hypothetical protein
MNALFIFLGFLILIASNQLPWLFVGAAGFLFGHYLAIEQRLARSPIDMIIFSLSAGALAILLVYYLKRLTIALAAFITGAYIITYIPEILGWSLDWFTWQLAVIVGLILAIVIFFWKTLPLILVSSLLGATLIAQYLNIGSITPTAMFFTFLILGILTQLVLMQYNPISEST